jgi:pimeloyl-ACP methyl ester carboxylesterase
MNGRGNLARVVVSLGPVLFLALAVACTSGDDSTAATPDGKPWTEEEVTFQFGSEYRFGVLTLPESDAPYPAVVLVSGSLDPVAGPRAGVSSRYLTDHARTMARSGYAVLRYDPPGVGGSEGESSFEPLDVRADEAIAAVHYLQARDEIRADRVGLWGESQGAWVIEIAAATYPDDVAFMIAVSGSGVSVAEQQVYSIESQSTAGGFSQEDVAKAVLFGRLQVDWQLDDPLYREINETAAGGLGDGPWTEFARLVYHADDLTPAEGLEQGIEILSSIQHEPWAKFLYLTDLYLPQLQSIPPDQVSAVREASGQTLLSDPKDHLTMVRSPVLAFFGTDDLLQPSATSADLYEAYLAEANNEDVTITVISGVGHSIDLSNPTYRIGLSTWLDGHSAD